MQKLLLNMTIIQLPIEYLWLTLDYDDRMMDTYTMGKRKWTQYFYDHPEYLTSEELQKVLELPVIEVQNYINFLTLKKKIYPSAKSSMNILCSLAKKWLISLKHTMHT